MRTELSDEPPCAMDPILSPAARQTPYTVVFFVPGIPRPGGSKTASIIRRKGGEIVMKNGRPLVTTRESGKHTSAWRADVKAFGQRAWLGHPIENRALQVRVEFFMPRPQNHYRTGKHAGELKPDAPQWHTSQPDATKLMRALEDALTGVIWTDDSRVVVQEVSKPYADNGCGARVWVKCPPTWQVT